MGEVRIEDLIRQLAYREDVDEVLSVLGKDYQWLYEQIEESIADKVSDFNDLVYELED